MGILIKNGHVIDPASGRDGIYDVLISGDIIADVGKDIPDGSNDVIDAAGWYVMPGLVDLHVHFREPGFEYKETVKTGTMAAAHGGVTSVFPMPNTRPVIDSVEMFSAINEIVSKDAVVNVFQVAADLVVVKSVANDEVVGDLHGHVVYSYILPVCLRFEEHGAHV